MLGCRHAAGAAADHRRDDLALHPRRRRVAAAGSGRGRPPPGATAPSGTGWSTAASPSAAPPAQGVQHVRLRRRTRAAAHRPRPCRRAHSRCRRKRTRAPADPPATQRLGQQRGEMRVVVLHQQEARPGRLRPLARPAVRQVPRMQVGHNRVRSYPSQRAEHVDSAFQRLQGRQRADITKMLGEPGALQPMPRRRSPSARRQRPAAAPT